MNARSGLQVEPQPTFLLFPVDLVSSVLYLWFTAVCVCVCACLDLISTQVLFCTFLPDCVMAELPSGLLEACVVLGASSDKLRDIYQVDKRTQ